MPKQYPKDIKEKAIPVEAEVKHDFGDTWIVHLIERQLQGHSNNVWETIEAYEDEDRAIDRKRMLNRLEPTYAHRITSHKLIDKLSQNTV